MRDDVELRKNHHEQGDKEDGLIQAEELDDSRENAFALGWDKDGGKGVRGARGASLDVGVNRQTR